MLRRVLYSNISLKRLAYSPPTVSICTKLFYNVLQCVTSSSVFERATVLSLVNALTESVSYTDYAE